MESEIRECTHSFINNTSSLAKEAFVVVHENLPTVRSSAEFAREDEEDRGSPLVQRNNGTTFGRKSSVHELKEKFNRESAQRQSFSNPSSEEAYVHIL